jgi:hypothetical protein
MSTPAPTLPLPVLGEVANAIVITNVQIRPFTSATVFVDIVNLPAPVDSAEPSSDIPTPRVLAQRAVPLTPEEYDLWGDDDGYVLAKVAEKLGMTLVT